MFERSRFGSLLFGAEAGYKPNNVFRKSCKMENNVSSLSETDDALQKKLPTFSRRVRNILEEDQ